MFDIKKKTMAKLDAPRAHCASKIDNFWKELKSYVVIDSS